MPLSLGRASHMWDCDGRSPDELKQETGWRYYWMPFVLPSRAKSERMSALRNWCHSFSRACSSIWSVTWLLGAQRSRTKSSVIRRIGAAARG